MSSYDEYLPNQFTEAYDTSFFGLNISARQVIENALVFPNWCPAAEELRLTHRSRLDNPFSALPWELLEGIEKALWKSIRADLTKGYGTDGRSVHFYLPDEYEKARTALRQEFGLSVQIRPDAWLEYAAYDCLALLILPRNDDVWSVKRPVTPRDIKIGKKDVARLIRAVNALRLVVYKDPPDGDVEWDWTDRGDGGDVGECPWTTEDDPEPEWILVHVPAVPL
ncbi:hypothetical protein DFJ74DRAFT_663999 [Hyaloraphidium curvatum]|nr:hypothetical protein DFJ74DRAFT_663999 [Hyaloraphidium curvatum]